MKTSMTIMAIRRLNTKETRICSSRTEFRYNLLPSVENGTPNTRTITAKGAFSLGEVFRLDHLEKEI